MVTFQAGRFALVTAIVGLAAACSGEQQDWRSAQSADTSEAWARFIDQHPDSELVGQARARIKQLDEERDWRHADSVATIEAYRSFLARHPAGHWSEEARIHIEGFSLGSAPHTTLPTPEEAAAIDAAARVHAFRLASAEVPAAASVPAGQPTPDTVAAAPVVAGAVAAEPVATGPAGVAVAAGPADLAIPGEAASPAPADYAQPAPADVAQPESSAAEHSPDASDARPSPANGYGVQLGAFGSEASADRAWQRLQGRFGSELAGLSPRIVVASSDSGQLYRLQAPAAGEAQARAICASLREQSQPCVPVVPR